MISLYSEFKHACKTLKYEQKTLKTLKTQLRTSANVTVGLH